MKINIKHKLSLIEADKLIEKYYDGLSTVEEEKKLHSFLSQPNLPERYKPEQAILGYFDHKKQKLRFSIQPYISWASAAAVIVTVMFCTQLFMEGNQSNYAYINGEKITDMREMKLQALASLSSISSETNEVEDGFKNLNDNKIIEQQLDVFSGLEK